eukprot:TRINITY_DN88239_c0_g1_i1.p1 TRINITY_DN88239_c0_g1~~TRINITY_DN88239_c0_g1_i1.p1  ORF type:complete len:273 (-),score=43.40 TRINITY_DN88239_c0_g1_i1:260-1078(-)
MFAGLKSRVANLRGNKSLASDLKRVTDSGATEIPKELLDVIVDAANDTDSRREIMGHLRDCYKEPSPAKRWRRIHAAMLLTEGLMLSGPTVILAETAEGHHFDVVQCLSFLEHFELTTDRAAQHMVRSKAKELRAALIPRLQSASQEGLLKQFEDTAASAENASTCSPGSSTGTLEDSEWHGVTLPKVPEGSVLGRQMILNGVVTVGHSEDTDDESSSDEAHAPVRYREQRGSSGRASEGQCRSKAPESIAPGSSKTATSTLPSPTVDLLGL